MTLSLYNYTGDPKVVNKSLGTALATKTVTLYGENVKESPTCTVPYSTQVLSANYAYIAELGRYYNIAKHNMLSGGRVELTLECDLLKSANSDIRASVGTFTRSNRRNVAISDPMVMKTSTVKVSYRKLGTPVPVTANGNYLISVAQGFTQVQQGG